MSPNRQWNCRSPAHWLSAQSALPQMSTGGAHITTPIHSLSLSHHLNLQLRQNGTRPLGLRCVGPDTLNVPLNGRCLMLLLTQRVVLLQCTVTCGGGVQARTVQCLVRGMPYTGCAPHLKPSMSQACNTNFCPQPEKKGNLHYYKVLCV